MAKIELNRIAVTGLGLMTGLGLDRETSWNGLRSGISPVRRFSLFDVGDLAAPFGVQLPEGADDLFARRIRKRSRRQMTRGTMIALVTAEEAVTDAGLRGIVDPSRAGVVIGATGTGYAHREAEGIDEHRILRNMASAPAAWVSLKLKFEGPSFVVSTACSSGIVALQAAGMLINSGQCDVVVAGAADSALNYPDVRGFISLMALSEDTENMETASRPFDRDRNGFVMGEGGGILVVESLEHARKRGARVYTELFPPALSSEAYNIISPRPDGNGMKKTMAQALRNAALEPSDIDYINAHGTSTLLNDRCETEAIKQVFGKAAHTVPVSSTKSMTGHCLSAAGGIEAVICCLAIRDGIMPPTANLHTPDPDLNLDFVPLKARTANLRYVMCNSFAFGGQNGVAIFRKPD